MKKCPQCGNEYPDTNTLCPADGVALEKTTDSLIGKTLAGKYRIEERLNEGGMGTVYRGTHVLMDKTVAVKVLRPSLAADEKIVARFSREARAASRISHPHALSVTDFGEAEDGVVFLVMEFLNGRTLKEVIRSEGPMDLERVVLIIRQVGDALDAAHEQGVVHRDLKSDNIMLLSTNGSEYAKVLDFGIAKINEPEGGVDPALTAPNLVIGTPQYMSPEQCSQSPDIDARSDVYSLGIILYEMLVGHVPFTGDSPTQIMLKQLQEPAPSVLDERSDLPASVGTVIARALAKLPENRYQAVADLTEDFTMAAGSANLSAAPESREAVNTGSSPSPVADDVDEVTVVRARPQQAEPLRTVVPVPPGPQPAYAGTRSAFNPWKIQVPSALGLLVVFAVIYAFTRNSSSTPSQTSPALVADPNSQPVQPSQPPTGNAEQGIAVGGPANNQPVNTNANGAASPTPIEDLQPNVNDGTNANSNENVNRATPEPSTTPKPTNVNSETPPPAPTPKSSPKSSPRPTLPPPQVSPSGIQRSAPSEPVQLTR